MKAIACGSRTSVSPKRIRMSFRKKSRIPVNTSPIPKTTRHMVVKSLLASSCFFSPSLIEQTMEIAPVSIPIESISMNHGMATEKAAKAFGPQKRETNRESSRV